MAVTAYTSAAAGPTASQVDKTYDLASVSLPQATLQLYGGGVDSLDGGAVWTYAWTLLQKPAGSAASLISGTVQNPVLQNVDVYGNYRLMLVVTNTNSGAHSETDPLKAPNTAFVQVRCLGANAGLQKPAAGERNWQDLWRQVVQAIEDLAGTAGASKTSPFLIDGADAGLPNARNIQALINALRVRRTDGVPVQVEPAQTSDLDAAIDALVLLGRSIGAGLAGGGASVSFGTQTGTGIESTTVTGSRIEGILSDLSLGAEIGSLWFRTLAAGVIRARYYMGKNVTTGKFGMFARFADGFYTDSAQDLEVGGDNAAAGLLLRAGAVNRWYVDPTTGALVGQGGNKPIQSVLDPVNPQDAATKAYADSVASGLVTKTAVRFATVTALAACTYANGAAGVGATLTANAVGALATVDSGAPVVGDRILVKNQAATLQNGIYTVTSLGSGGSAWVLTRATDTDTAAELRPGTFLFVCEGTILADTGWVLSTDAPITIGTTGLAFTQFSAAGVILAGSYLSKSGVTVSALVPASSASTAPMAATASQGVGTRLAIEDHVHPTTPAVDGEDLGSAVGNRWDLFAKDLEVKGKVCWDGPVLKSGTYAITSSDGYYTILLDASGGAFDLTLPTAGVPNKGRELRFKKIDSSANAITVKVQASEYLEGVINGTYSLDVQNKSIDVQSAANLVGRNDWFIMGQL
jgi:hypothetical protein